MGWSCRQDHRQVRDERIRVGCHEVPAGLCGALGEALRRSGQETFLPRACQVHGQRTGGRHGLGGSQRCQDWPRPTQPTASRAPSGETSVSRWDVTSVTEVTRSSRPRRKSPCGSRRTNWSTGTPVRRPGYTSRVTAVYVYLHKNEDYKNRNYLMKINRFTFGK